jgi:hypothetical protein
MSPAAAAGVSATIFSPGKFSFMAETIITGLPYLQGYYDLTVAFMQADMMLANIPANAI